MDIKALAEKYNDYIIERRRYYHTCPEPSLKEEKTIAQIKADLEAAGITDIHMCKNCYGLAAYIHGGKPGKTVAVRADIDSLPVLEKTGLPFASKNEGYMHACGHDNHIAMQLGAASILNEVKDELSGTVKLIFQPSEENAKGAKLMLEEGILDDVDAIYGAHIWGNFDEFEKVFGELVGYAESKGVKLMIENCHMPSWLEKGFGCICFPKIMSIGGSPAIRHRSRMKSRGRSNAHKPLEIPGISSIARRGK